MQHQTREERGVTIVCLAGEVDLENSPKAREVLLGCLKGATAILVDLKDVTYIDSSGVASLVEAFQGAKKQGTAFALAEVNPAARRVLELARLDRVFTIHATVAEGIDGVA